MAFICHNEGCKSNKFLMPWCGSTADEKNQETAQHTKKKQRTPEKNFILIRFGFTLLVALEQCQNAASDSFDNTVAICAQIDGDNSHNRVLKSPSLSSSSSSPLPPSAMCSNFLMFIYNTWIACSISFVCPVWYPLQTVFFSALHLSECKKSGGEKNHLKSPVFFLVLFQHFFLYIYTF